jgi:phosphatidylethanolamine/phosphatidyl-N-methylethanolamine N-methyltransferase
MPSGPLPNAPRAAPCDTPSWLEFLRAARRDPIRIGAIAPSGRALSQLMTREVDPRNGPVLELGPGSGAFTRALLQRGVAEDDLTLIEYEPRLAQRLMQEFPAARVLQADAARSARWLPDAWHGAAVSGLPLLNFALRSVVAILKAVFHTLRPGGALYQFTYGPRAPVALRVLQRLGLRADFVGRTWRNLPPAAVYRIARIETSRAG